MRLLAKLGRFLRCRDAAVTVDWVVLTAAVVGLTLGVLSALFLTTDGVITEVGGDMGTATDISDLVNGSGGANDAGTQTD